MSDALATLFGSKVAGYIGSAVGVVLFVLGWLRSRAGRSVGRAILALGNDDVQTLPSPEHQARTISQKEWHDIRGDVHKLLLGVGQMKKTLAKVEGATARDHDLLTEVRVEVENLKRDIEQINEHCDHCPMGPR